MPERADRLSQAVARGMLPGLGDYGFRSSGSSAGDRGSTVECTNGPVLIRVQMDWLEGELSVHVQKAGESARPIESLVDLSAAKGLRLTRLPKGATVEKLATQLSKVTQALTSQAPDLLRSSGDR